MPSFRGASVSAGRRGIRDERPSVAGRVLRLRGLRSRLPRARGPGLALARGVQGDVQAPLGGSMEPATKAVYAFETCRRSKARLSARWASAFSAKTTTPEASLSIRWTTQSRRPSCRSSRRCTQSGADPSRVGMTGSPDGFCTATTSSSSCSSTRGGSVSDTPGPYRPSRPGANRAPPEAVAQAKTAGKSHSSRVLRRPAAASFAATAPGRPIGDQVAAIVGRSKSRFTSGREPGCSGRRGRRSRPS